MKALPVLILSLIFLGISPAVFAGVPSLVGTWDIHAEGAILLHGAAPGKYTHWSRGQTTITGTAHVVSQDGRTLKGYYMFPKNPESFIAVIGTDGNLHLVDEDGFADYRFVNSNRLEGVYRHVTSTDSVICNSVWTRRK